MPFYEYECPVCKYYAEVLQKISDPPIRKCPSCGKGGFKRLISAPVFRLKGSGWYETDFKSDQDRKRNLAGGDREEAKGAPEDKAAAKPDGKAAGEPAKAGAESAKSESTPAPKADKPDTAGKSGSSPARRSAPSRSAKPAHKRIVKRAAKPAARGDRGR
jgi:putative FmdB family regulatory protein